MTIFEKDLQAVRNGNGSMILRERKAKIDNLIAEGRGCKNAFRMECIAQEVAKLQREYKILDENF